jgi:hypothetical protein
MWCSIVNDTAPEKLSSENGISDASPSTTSTFDPRIRERNELASPDRFRAT